MEKFVAELHKHINGELEVASKWIARFARAKVQEVLMQKKHVATMELYNAIENRVEKLVDKYVISVYVDTRKVPQAIYLSKGTKPHFPPVKSIANWIRAKKRTVGFDVQSNQIDKVAWAIAYSISRKGTKSFKFLDLGLKRALPLIKSAIDRMEL